MGAGLDAADQRERAQEVGAAVGKRLSAFLQGTAFVASVDAVFIGLGLFIVGIPLAGSLAVRREKEEGPPERIGRAFCMPTQE